MELLAQPVSLVLKEQQELLDQRDQLDRPDLPVHREPLDPLERPDQLESVDQLGQPDRLDLLDRPALPDPPDREDRRDPLVRLDLRALPEAKAQPVEFSSILAPQPLLLIQVKDS
jgi:hypothetical protein